MLYRFFDIVISLIVLILAGPLLLVLILLIFLQDYHSPFYVAPRVGKDEKLFKMIKLRSMIAHADKFGVDSTSANDQRITAVGRFIRKYKIDELSQFINVLIGDMSIIGPRPNVPREVALYTEEEKTLLSVKPGITDFSSIVFNDEGAILKDKEDPDIAYNQLIRPWKSRLGLIYIQHRSLILNVKLIWLTMLATISKKRALNVIHSILIEFNTAPNILKVVLRIKSLIPFPPPGSSEIIMSRKK